MEIVIQKQQTVLCKVLTDIGQTVEDSSVHSDTEPKTVHCELLTDSGQIVEDSSGHSDTGPTFCTV